MKCGVLTEEQKEKRRASARRWKAKNKDHLAGYDKKWRAENPDKVKANDRARNKREPGRTSARSIVWRRVNRDRHLEASRNWKRSNRNLVNAAYRRAYAKDPTMRANHRHRRRAAEGNFKRQDIEAIALRQDHRCNYCGAMGKLHIDHIMPIKLGGTNWPDNLQLLCRPCNQAKGSKHPSLFPKYRSMSISGNLQ